MKNLAHKFEYISPQFSARRKFRRGICGKTVYPGKEIASHEAKRIGSEHQVALGVYHCNACNGFHLTSK